MTNFLRLLTDNDKDQSLSETCIRLRHGQEDLRHFKVSSESFNAVPGRPFAYWVSNRVRQTFERLPAFESSRRPVRVGLQTGDDFRFLRLWWEVGGIEATSNWLPVAKGGAFSRYYADIYLVANWADDGKAMVAFSGSVIRNPTFYFRHGLTWPCRTNGLSFRVLPEGCLFTHKGPAAFVAREEHDDAPLALLALTNSQAFGLLVSVQLARAELAQSFEVGLIQQTPVPDLDAERQSSLADLVRRAWSLKYGHDSIAETSHAFRLPLVLQGRIGGYDPRTFDFELARIESAVDEIAKDLYGFGESVLEKDMRCSDSASIAGEERDVAIEDDVAELYADTLPTLLSWVVGVTFGRFDFRLATGEREVLPEPKPFDPLPKKSPGMLPDGDELFHRHSGILVDDPGHPHDLTQLMELVLERVDVSAPDNLRLWLQKDFFKEHLKQYSKSRRKAPIYWPLATASGGYTLWIYYPDLDDQTLYTAVNDFLEPKLKLVGGELNSLRAKSSRSVVEERELEQQQDLEQELIELRDTILKIAPTYKPNHDDGVQITAAPLWPLFRHKPWQKLLKETWEKLEAGEYDWAHMAYSYWHERVREKCETDKSLAIAHNLEDLYEEPAA